MTTGRPDTASERLRDPRFDAAWRAASREEPPAALDAAILGAARRAVGARPQPADVREATRPERWWWPLAAAASIGAVAIGILQLVATDQAGAPDAGRAIVSDMPASRPYAPSQAPSSGASSAPAPASTTAPAVPPSPGSNGNAGAREEPAALRKETHRLQSSDSLSRVPSSVEAKLPAAGLAARDRTPAAVKIEAAEAPVTNKDAGMPAAAEAARSGGASNPATAPAAPPARQAAPSPPPAGDDGAGSPRAAAPFPTEATAPRSLERDTAPPAALGKVVPAPAAAARADGQAKARAPLPVAEWIALIRKLRAEGRTEEVAREIAAFKAAYPDQQRLLVDGLSDAGMPQPPAR